jgi:hypothetical protein
MSETIDIAETHKVGMKIDIYDDKLKNWLPGKVKEFERIDSKSAKLVVSKDNLSDDSNESLTWPNDKKLAYCGEKVKDRECDKDSQVFIIFLIKLL